MTGREIILKAMRFEDTERLPVGVLDGYTWMLNQMGISFKQLFEMPDGAQAVAEQYSRLGTDIVYSNGHVFNVVHRVMGGEIHCDGMGETVEITKAPLSEIGGYTAFNADEVMEKAYACDEYQQVLAQAKKLSEILGCEKLVSTLSYGPFTVAGMLVGVQNFMVNLYEDEDETLGLVDFAADLVISNAEKFLECGAEAVFVADPVASGDLISPNIYADLALPALKKICAHFKAKNIPVFLHICGHTEKRLEPMLQSGISAFSVDSIDIKMALDVARGHYTILGNFSPFDVLMSLSPEEIRTVCDARIREAGKGGGYMLFPGCDLAPLTPIENVQAMVAAAHEAK